MEILKSDRVRLSWFTEKIFLFKNSGVEVHSANSKYNAQYSLPLKQLLKATKQSVRSSKTRSYFEEAVSRKSKSNEWSLSSLFFEYALLNNKEYLLFEVYAPNPYWSAPWELLLSELFLKHQERVKSTGVLRIFDALKPEYPNTALDKLDILFIKGEEAKGSFEELDLTTGINAFIESWSISPSYVKSSISEPQVVDSSINGLSERLRKHDPDILIYYGHGRSKPEPGLYFSPKTWVSPEQFKVILDESGIKPMYVIFLACDVAKNTNDPSLKYPKFFVDLIGKDVLAIMGMQAPITLGASKILLNSLFESLALGYSMEIASVIARYNLKHLATTSTNSMDCFSPVLWSKGNYPVKLKWNHKAAIHQSLAYIDLRYNHKKTFNTSDVKEDKLNLLSEILKKHITNMVFNGPQFGV